MGRRHAEIFLDLLRGEGFAKLNPQPMFPNPPAELDLCGHGPVPAKLLLRSSRAG